MATGSWGEAGTAGPARRPCTGRGAEGLQGRPSLPHLCCLAKALLELQVLGGQVSPFLSRRCLGIETLPHPSLVWVHLRVVHYADLVREADNSVGPGEDCFHACAFPALLFVDRLNDLAEWIWGCLSPCHSLYSLISLLRFCYSLVPEPDSLGWSWVEEASDCSGLCWSPLCQTDVFPRVTGCVCAIEDAVIVPGVYIFQCIFS